MTHNTINTTIELKDNHTAEFFFDNAGDFTVIFRKNGQEIGIVIDYRQVGIGFCARNVVDGYSALTLELLARQLSKTEEFAQFKSEVMK